MRDEVREYLRREPERRARAAKFFNDVPDVEEDLGEAVLDAQLDAAERLDPGLAATSLLVVRLSGDGIIDGWVDQHIQDEILGPLVQEVELAAPPAARDAVRMGLVGVSTGSVLLHYRPRLDGTGPKQGQLAYNVHPADSAVLRVSELHDLLERQEPGAVVASAFKDDHQLLRQTRKLVEALDKFSINLSTRWWGPTSRRRRSVLTQVGQVHGLRVFAASEKDETVTLQGMVTGLDIAGIVTVTGSANHKYKVDVGHNHISDPAFTLGAQVFLMARKKQEVDNAGVRQGHPRFEFIQHIDHAPLEDI